MKKIILFMLLFVNLQIITKSGDFIFKSAMTAYAQHMYQEPGDNCQDPETFLWYKVPNGTCEFTKLGFPCAYCQCANDTEEERAAHEENCSKRNPEEHKCRYCGSSFGSDPEVENHEQNCPAKNQDLRNTGTETNTYVSTLLKPSGGGGGGSGSSSGFKKYDITKIYVVADQVCIDVTHLHGSNAACNIGVQELYKRMMGELDNALIGRANDIALKLPDSNNWVNISQEDAYKYAAKGNFVVASWYNQNGGSGHIVAVLPNTNVMDTGPGPNVGKTTSHGINGSFGKNKQPDVNYYVHK